MFTVRTGVPSRGLKVGDHVPFGHQSETFDQLHGERPCRGTNERGVKFPVSKCDFVQSLVNRFVETFKCLANLLALVLVRGARGKRCSFRLDRAPKCENLVGFVETHWSHEIAAVRLTSQKSFLLEARKSLAQRDLADAEFSSERVLPDRQVACDLT